MALDMLARWAEHGDHVLVQAQRVQRVKSVSSLNFAWRQLEDSSAAVANIAWWRGA